MAITQKSLSDLLKGGQAEAANLSSQQVQGMKGQQSLADISAQGGQQRQNIGATGQMQGDLDQRKMKNAADLIKTEVGPDAFQREGSSYKAGDITIGADPAARLAAKGPEQALRFVKQAQGAYKGINDQLDSSKATLDNLNVGNSTGDKLALINEAKLSLGGSGSRALGQMVSLLSGDRSMASDSQKALNWLQNTPNIPTLQPAQRDAIRESVFSRVPQIAQMHSQANQQLMQLGPQVAPQSDYGAITKSFVEPANQKLSDLNKMQQDYSQSRAQMQQNGNNPISAPSTVNQNPTTIDKLKSLFGMSAGAQTQPAQSPQGASPDVQSQVQRLQQLRNKAGQ